MDERPIDAIEPDQWFVAFHTTAKSRLLSFLAAGKYKHVSAFAYLPGLRAWVIYDAEWRGLRLLFFSHEAAKAVIAERTRDAAIVKINRLGRSMGLSSRVALYCVSTIKHLLGVRCPCVRPEAFYAYLLRNGGELIDESINTVPPGRS